MIERFGDCVKSKMPVRLEAEIQSERIKQQLVAIVIRGQESRDACRLYDTFFRAHIRSARPSYNERIIMPSVVHKGRPWRP